MVEGHPPERGFVEEVPEQAAADNDPNQENRGSMEPNPDAPSDSDDECSNPAGEAAAVVNNAQENEEQKSAEIVNEALQSVTTSNR